ncbi:MAG: hypothetical protein DRJ31_02495 [Candidatus Methanomethylicota archaeon]|uniref:Aspartate/glutamate/uridylate kinase domain-containing protein n=1 Tax=Thermoproteota archaeon TaxID=2056631 RepID=A0A497ERV1_9CREN|nr:MAG: hypothetical protein DRJ31_02495 [Candidatus Verstraetearchaeota archaeon]RLE52488.1 MAG: hypothetical protein DRJ33_03680 [Candidatus Verstraetearchaeota archaeon]
MAQIGELVLRSREEPVDKKEVDCLIKIGGSLLDYPDSLVTLCRGISDLRFELKLAIVPGGGWFADVVRRAYAVFLISEEKAHDMAVLGMDQYAHLLAHLINGSILVESLEELLAYANSFKIPITLSSRFNLEVEKSWNITSDSIAAYIATYVKPRKLVLVKDVDGVYTSDPKRDKDAKLLTDLHVQDLEKLSSSCLDRRFSHYLKMAQVSCVVVNGLYLNRVVNALRGKPDVYTTIYV